MCEGMAHNKRLIGVAIIAITVTAAQAHGQGLVQDDSAPIPPCEQQLASSIESLVRPVLLARAAALQAKREWDGAFEESFYGLLKQRSPAAEEAQVALMAYYTGEHYGEELVERVMSKPKVFGPLVAKYRLCRPNLTFEDQLRGVVVLRTLYDIYESERQGK